MSALDLARIQFGFTVSFHIIYPPLAGSPSVLQPNPINLVQTVRHGGFAPATQAHPRPFWNAAQRAR